MNYILDIWNNPGAHVGIWAGMGTALTLLVWPLLEKLVAKTPSKSDDEFLASIESIVNAAIAKKKSKPSK